MEIEELKQIITYCWNEETCSPGLKENWCEENPSLGQCAITTLIVNDFFGGKIMRCMTPSGSHYYNLIDNEVIDLTVEQFLGRIPHYEKGEQRTREYLLGNEDTKKRYLLLNKKLKNIIEKENKSIYDDVSNDFSTSLYSYCSREFYVDTDGIIKQKKK